VTKRELHDALAGADVLRWELRRRGKEDRRDDQMETMSGEMLALAEQIAFERITSRDEIEALKVTHPTPESSRHISVEPRDLDHYARDPRPSIL